MRRVLLLNLCLLMFLAYTEAGWPQENPLPQHTAIRAEMSGGKNMKVIEASCDRFFLEQMQRWHIPGLSFVVLHQDKPILAKGYGYSDLAQEKQVKADRTVFRIGSVSKLITATACMQLVEARKLYLRGDVNQYLKDFKIPQTFGEPVSTWNLLTHTAGFDDRFVGIAKASPEELTPLGPYLAQHLPPRIQPPGEVVNYSNFGITLAAYVVECISGQPFETWVDTKICRPLEMEPGGFRQPLPNELAKRLAVSYVWNGSENTPAILSEGASQVWPAGAYATSALDLATFMQAHLGMGNAGGKRILSPPSVRGMHAQQFIHDPHLIRGQCLGFRQRRYNGRTVLWHTGRVQGFTSQFMMIPSAKAGIVVLCNGNQGDQLRVGVLELIGDLFIEKRDSLKALPPLSAPKEILDGLSGAYLQVRRVRSGFEKLAFFGKEILFRPDGEGGLIQHPYGKPEEVIDQWRPVASSDGKADLLLFEALDSPQPRRLIFQLGKENTVDRVIIEPEALTVLNAFDRLKWYERSDFQWYFGILCLLLVATLCFRIPAGLLWSRWKHTTPPKWLHIGNLAALFSALAAVVFSAGLYLDVSTTDPYLFTLGLSPSIKLLLALPLMIILSAALHSIAAVNLFLSENSVTLAGKLHLVFGSLAVWAFLWVLSFWNCLGYYG